MAPRKPVTSVNDLEWPDGDGPVAVAVPENPADEVAKYMPAMANLLTWLGEHSSGTEEDEFAAMERMIAEVMRSETPDQILAEKLLVSGKNLVGKTLMVFGFEIAESEIEGDGAPFYARLDCQIRPDDTRRVVSVGGWMILGQLKRLDEVGEWPQAVCIVAKPTKKGFTALNLGKPGATDIPF